MKYAFTFLAMLLVIPIFSQNNAGHVYNMVMEQASQLRHAQHYNLFDVDRNGARSNEFEGVLREATVLRLDPQQLKDVRRSNVDRLTMSVPRSDGRNFDLTLIKSNLFTEDFTMYAASAPERLLGMDFGDHYVGIIDGDGTSAVALSISDHTVAGLIMNDDGNFVLGQVEGTRDQYVLYNDKDLVPGFSASCDTEDDDYSYTLEELSDHSSSRDVGDCVRVYIEVHEDITNQRGSVSEAAFFVTAVFNQSAVLYANDNMTIVLSEIKVWDMPSPYTSTSTSTLLSQFQSNVGDFNGDLGHLIGYDGSGGIAAGFAGICNPNSDESMCYSGIQSTYANVPTYSWSVFVVTHEMGHLFGCRHTHACVWNGNNTAIDGCAGGTEGSCALPGNPANGGTIMSYCHQTSVGINFNLGFGPQPGNVARNSVANGSCLSQCGNNTCGTPGNLSVSGIGDTGATLSWGSLSDALSYDVDYRESGASSWTTSNTTATSVSITGLQIGTTYEWRVRANCSGVTGNYSTPSSFTTTGNPPASYCGSEGSTTQYEWIQSVEVANLANDSGADGGYADYTSLVADLQAGESYTLELTPGGSYTEQWRVWIDYNGDLDFDDAGEQVASVSGSGTLSASFVVPVDATGSTRMRVSMKWGSAPSPCETFSYGEVEDYTVSFMTASCDVPDFLSTTDITDTGASLSWAAVNNATSYTVQFRAAGSSAWDLEADVSSAGAIVSGLTQNSTYEWRVRSNCANGSSDYAAVKSFTTLESGGCSLVDVIYDDFETSLGNWNDGGSDCRRSANDANYAIGTYCVRLRDNSNTSIMTTDNLDLGGFTELTVAFSYYPRSMDNQAEDFWLQVSLDGGSVYTTVEEWNLGDEFQNGRRYFDTVVITQAFSPQTRLRFRCDASGNSDWVYIDNVDVKGCNASALRTPTIQGVDLIEVDAEAVRVAEKNVMEEEADLVLKSSGLLVYPNPTDDQLNVECLIDRAQVIEVYLVAMDGQIVRQIKQHVEAGHNDYELNVGQMSSGVYSVVLRTESDVKTTKVVIH